MATAAAGARVSCPAILPGDAFLSGLLGYVDCQAQTIGMGGYLALAAAGSPAAVLLGVLVTIFVALFGYRMLLGQVPDLRDGVRAVVRIGLVLVLATSWPAFRTLAYDVTMSGPAELAASIGGGAGLPGAGDGLVARLQRIDNGLVELLELGTGRPDIGNAQLSATTPTASPEAGQQRQDMQRMQLLSQRPRWDPEKEASRVGAARTIFLTSEIAAFASVRLIAGLLLALGPLFGLFLLFDATRGLFEGWVRGVAGAALGALGTAIVLGVQLALVEPWLASVLFQRRQDIPTPSVPVELLVMALVFALTLLAVLIATAKVAAGFRIPDTWRALPARIADAVRGTAPEAMPADSERRVPAAERSRASAIADAVAATQRRETAAVGGTTIHGAEGQSGGPRSGGVHQAVTRDIAVAAAVPLGQSGRRRIGTRVSARAGRRDRGA
jgi:type IV secretion system protein VirB6